MDLVVHSPDELLAAMPHLLGFKPEESIVVVPFGSGLPVARVDLPRTMRDREEVSNSIGDVYERHARPGARVGIVCITEDVRSAEIASQHLSTRLSNAGITTDLRLCSDGERWQEFNTGATGAQTQATAGRIAATTVLTGAAQPAPSREALAASLVGDREPLARVLPEARAAASTRSPSSERDWALDRLRQFHTDGNRFTDIDGARMLVALQTIGTRDALWQDMSSRNSASHSSLWSDLTRRAPDEVRAAPASMLGFASWLQGNGARAWCALDEVPADQPYSMAAIVASALENGLHPGEWERHRTQVRELTSEVDESFVPRPPGQHDQRGDAPQALPASDGPTPGR